MKEDVKNYLTTLKRERLELLNRVKKIEEELEEWQIITTIVKDTVTQSKDYKYNEVCSVCNGKGEYWDYWAGTMPCPECSVY